MEEQVSPQQEHIYAPAVAIAHATLKYSWNKIPVTTVATPGRVCGEAKRIGYTGKEEHDLALYRIKIKMGQGYPTVTLPELYIIEDGMFQEYEQWQQTGYS